MPATLDGDNVRAVTIDGEDVYEITMDGDIVWQATRQIDDFESYGDLSNNWTLDGSGSSTVSTSAALHANSTQGVEQSGTAQMRSFPGYGLPNYVEDGKEHMLLMEPHSTTQQPHLLINMDSDEWSTNSGNSNWRIEFHVSGDNGTKIVYHDGSTRDIRATDDHPHYDWPVGTTHDIRFKFDSTNGITVWAYDETGTEVSKAHTNDTFDIDPEMNLGLRTESGVYWDWIHIVPDNYPPQA